MLTVFEHAHFIRHAEKILTEEQRIQLIDFISVHYDKGDVIQGTGGIQKIRFAHQSGKGKSGAARVIYFAISERGSVHLIDIFEKNVKDNISDSEKNVLKKLTALLKKKE